MTEQFQETAYQLSEETALELFRSLLHKEGSWVNWGQKCQTLQKGGYDSQTIFEQTGFQAAQQNLIIVASQVFESLVNGGAKDDLLDYYRGPRSDILYEFRILNAGQRLAAAVLARDKRLELEEAHEAAKAIQEVSHISQLPSEFTRAAGDAVAYQCWKRAKQKRDLQERARLIAKGLKFVVSDSGRRAIEALLSDFSTTTAKSAPLLPVHRLEDEDQLARIIPFVGEYPLHLSQVTAASSLIVEPIFHIVEAIKSTKIVPLPGWQSVLKATDPVAILWPTDELPRSISSKPEKVLVVIDRAATSWNENSYFLTSEEDKLGLQWFAEEPEAHLIGQLVVILRAKNILDENNLTEPWQMDD
ncbi:MAG: hypothetical protein N5P05_000087 [Chroococcopsis gigantea SAG 12.99]|jgi:hypothetical protein|nr:hypothetical protein [Chlorogloea purpurea SAG 13.99]MDV2998481.1 hypothetical protein [Chroococcopsis gigantea SAG 12.99]